MVKIESSRFSCVGECGQLIKHGKTKSGNQRYSCKLCGKTKVEKYIYRAYQPTINDAIIQLTKEGVGIRSTARILKISATTLLKRIIVIAGNIQKPPIVRGRIYEVDEMRTFVGSKKKLAWIVYALEPATKIVVCYKVGNRTNQTLGAVTKTLELAEAAKIYTDGLKNYKTIIPANKHFVKRFGTNHIERKNLTLRTHLKRLSRKTISFSRSIVVLNAVLKIYFWS